MAQRNVTNSLVGSATRLRKCLVTHYTGMDMLSYIVSLDAHGTFAGRIINKETNSDETCEKKTGNDSA